MSEQEEVINQSDWEALKGYPDYEICRIYPYSIRRAKDGGPR